MREILITNRFKKDLKKAKKNPRQDTDKLLYAIEVLAIHGRLPEEYLAHCLSGNWKPKWVSMANRIEPVSAINIEPLFQR